MTVEQSQLVDQHCSKSEAGGVNPALGGDLTVHIEDGLEMLVEVLVGQATQFVEDAPNLYSGISVRVGSSFGGDQKPLCPLAFVAYVLGVVMGISQNEACLQVQLPSINPPVPAGFGPASLGVYGAVGYYRGFLVFLMPYSAFGLQSGAVKSYRPTPTLPGLEHFHQVAPQAADLLGKSLGQSLKTPLEGAPCGEASLLTKELAHHLHLGGGFLKSCQELSHPMQPSEDHDHQSLHKELLRVEGRPSTATPQWRWRTRNALDKDNQLDKDTLLSDHGWASGSSVHGHTPSSEASRSGASSDEVLYYL